MRWNVMLLSFLLASAGALNAKDAGKAAVPGPYDESVQSLLGRQYVKDLSGAENRRSVRGTTSLWTQVLLQKGSKSAALENLERDLRLTELEDPLREAGIEILEPKAQPLSLGSKPTLVLNVYFQPKHPGQDQAYYLVTLRSMQEVHVSALGGVKLGLATWMTVSAPLLSTGNDGEDAAAIRRAAREAVGAFIKAVQDED